MTNSLDDAIDRAIDERRIVGAVALVAEHDEITYRRSAGLADREAGVPVREDAIFLLASVTKPFVSAAAMRLVESGQLSLRAPVTDYLMDFRPAMADGTVPPISVHQLLTHTAGLGYRFRTPSGAGYDAAQVSDGLDQPGLSLAENLRRIAGVPLEYVPGSSWAYSVAMDVIGGVLAAVTGTNLATSVRELVTDPLGSTDTGFAVIDKERLVTHYVNTDAGPQRIGPEQLAPTGPDTALHLSPSRLLDPTSYDSGGAGMAGTAGDVLRLLETIRTGGGQVLGRRTVEHMRSVQVGAEAETEGPGWGFGYGWAVLVDPTASGTPQSRGSLQWGGAYGHKWFIDPARELTVVVLTNTAFEGLNGRFTEEVRDAVYAG